MSERVARVLEKAAEKIRTVGWCQHKDVERVNGKPIAYCADAALAATTESSARDRHLYHPAVIALKRAMDADWLSDWNDAQGRTKRQVLAAFSRAIKAERARGKK